MNKYELSNVWLQKNSDKVKKAYGLAVMRKYDIKSNEDVLEIIKAIDPENATEENAKIFSGILQLFAQGIKRNFEPKVKTKPKSVH